VASVLPAEAGIRAGRVTHSTIAGIGVYLPAGSLPSAPQLSGANILGVSDRVQLQHGVSTPSLAAEAARQAIRSAGGGGDTIDLIVVGTTSPDVLWPSTACLVQTELGLPMAGSFDLYAAETGVVTALAVADQYVRTGSRGALVIGAESDKPLVDSTGETRPHGRAAAAVVLRPASGSGGLLSCVIGAAAAGDGTSRDTVLLHGLSLAVDRSLREAGVGLAAIDLVIAEQTAPEVMRVWAKSRQLPMDRLLLDPERYRVPFAAAPLVALHDAVAGGRLQSGMLALLVSCGQGPTWGAACVRWEKPAVAA
jgi:3-oxoacyl-[acyl-carrier-protein] synthase III